MNSNKIGHFFHFVTEISNLIYETLQGKDLWNRLIQKAFNYRVPVLPSVIDKCN